MGAAILNQFLELQWPPGDQTVNETTSSQENQPLSQVLNSKKTYLLTIKLKYVITCCITCVFSTNSHVLDKKIQILMFYLAPTDHENESDLGFPSQLVPDPPPGVH